MTFDPESALNPLYMANPRMTAELEVLGEFPRGMLGFWAAEREAKEKGALHLFQAAYVEKIDRRAKRIETIARIFIGGYATYLRQRSLAAEQGPDALGLFDAGIDNRVTAALAA